MAKTIYKRASLLGLFILVGLSMLIAGILTLTGQRHLFTHSIRVTTLFHDVQGLQPGANVWYEGIKVGTVRGLAFAGRRQVRVDMNIDRSAAQFLRKDCQTGVGLDGLIGNRIVVLRGGEESSPPISDGDVLIAGGAQSGSDILGILGESGRNLLAITADLKEAANKVNKGNGTVGRLLNDGALVGGLQAAVGRVQRAAGNIQQASMDIRSFAKALRNPDGLAAQVVNDTIVFSLLRSAAARINQAAVTASEVMDTAYPAVSALNDTARPVGMMLGDRQAAADLRATITNLRKSSAELAEDLEALQHNFLLRGFFKKKQQKPAP